MTTKVEYLDEYQLGFIEQVEELLQRAKEGKTIGCAVFELDNEGYIELEYFGILPDDRSLIAELSAAIADCTVNMSLDATFDAMEAME